MKIAFYRVKNTRLRQHSSERSLADACDSARARRIIYV